MIDTRFESLKMWLNTLTQPYALNLDAITPASSDASFRRYFRVMAHEKNHASLIVMDAPVDQEDVRPFLKIAKQLANAQVLVPQIYAENLKEGFLLLSDFGNQTLLGQILPENADQLYRKVNTVLIAMQKNTSVENLPIYDDTLLRKEMALFPQWYLGTHLGLEMSDTEKNDLESVFNQLVGNAISQTQVFTHRDFHSRNLMVTATNTLGVLDFQDAVLGPITYDLVSMYRDAYIGWEEEQQMDWVVRYWEMAKKQGLPVPHDFGDFYRNFEWMGLQRHLKVLGIFARLFYRDGKNAYLKDLPLVLNYAQKVAERYTVFKPLVRIFDRAQHIQRPTGFTF
jgi:hypothetical protein